MIFFSKISNKQIFLTHEQLILCRIQTNFICYESNNLPTHTDIIGLVISKVYYLKFESCLMVKEITCFHHLLVKEN